jgi:Flp pilus assembly protein TadB
MKRFEGLEAAPWARNRTVCSDAFRRRESWFIAGRELVDMDISPKRAFLLSLAAFVAIIVAVALIWALVGSGTALILGLAVFVVFYGTLVWLYRKTKHEPQ